ncbi:MAG: hypothetical protein N4A63_16960 [Vallitalea sp.]|jgi:hypothetical protein|nr:hypothetical protein [Vallitalea sp.]
MKGVLLCLDMDMVTAVVVEVLVVMAMVDMVAMVALVAMVAVVASIAVVVAALVVVVMAVASIKLLLNRTCLWIKDLSFIHFFYPFI